MSNKRLFFFLAPSFFRLSHFWLFKRNFTAQKGAPDRFAATFVRAMLRKYNDFEMFQSDFSWEKLFFHPSPTFLQFFHILLLPDIFYQAISIQTKMVRHYWRTDVVPWKLWNWWAKFKFNFVSVTIKCSWYSKEKIFYKFLLRSNFDTKVEKIFMNFQTAPM